MKPSGFTLIELQVSLLLTIASLGSLFLLTLYFWQNHHERGQILQFQKEADLFFDWHQQQMRRSAQIQPSANQVQFTAFDGTKTVLKFTDQGPAFGQVHFFSMPTKVNVRYEDRSGGWDVHVSIERMDLQLKRSWQQHYSKLEIRDLRGLR